MTFRTLDETRRKPFPSRGKGWGWGGGTRSVVKL